MLSIDLVQALITAIVKLFPSISDGTRRYIDSLTNQLPQLVASGEDVVSFIQNQEAIMGRMVSERRDPTQEEWDALNATKNAELDALRAGATDREPQS